MASNESNTLEDQLQIQQENMPTAENTETQTEMELEKEIEIEKETETEINTSSVAIPTQRSPSYRGVRLSQSSNNDEANDEEDDIEDSWWLEVENGDLLLDQVPNVTSVFTPTPESIVDQKLSPEDESVLNENFDRLHKIADKIKMTLNEHAKNKEIEEKAEKAERERKSSESSDKENANKTAKQYDLSETDCSPVAAYKEQSFAEFKEELRTKRIQRQDAVQNLRDEITSLRKQLDMEREITRRLRQGEYVEEIAPKEEISTLTKTMSESVKADNELGACALVKSSHDADDNDDADPLSRSRHANIELANAQLALQMANSENISLRGELAVVQKQVFTLKEVIACCKQMLAVKEEQCNELKQRLTEIEKSFAEHEMKIMSDNLRQEYERQLVNIRQLRQLYEERQRVAAAEYENLQRLISIKRDELAQEQEKTKSLEERNQNLMKEVETANNELACLRDECKEHKFEKSALKEEIGAVNTLFSQMVMGFNGKNNLDIDRLTTMLEENRTLLNDMATKECTDGATLPKLLFELVEQATTGDDNKKEAPESQVTATKTPATTSEAPSKEHVGMNENFTTPQAVSDDDEEEGGSTTGEEEGVQENDNENMASLTSNTQDNEMPSVDVVEGESTACSASSHEHHNDDDDASKLNEKVIVTTQNKLKKHHRKLANNKKSSSTTSSNVAAATVPAAATTMRFHDSEVIGKVTSAQEIIGNLPKVWRVLMELLSHHKIDPVQFEENGKGEDCYKSVETPNGPKAELSVSKTYIKLKDLILEKKSLVKETNRLKTLNCHLDYRLNEQEKRLSAVSLELTKTWHLVGKMQRQHRQLHTQEQILRYQLQQKRRLLSELKDELEYCRRKWAAARAKNDESQEQCNDLRREFARRKQEDANNSAESGYSDSGGQASDEEVQIKAGEEKGDIRGVEEVKERKSVPDDEDDDLQDAKLASASAAGGCVNYRRKRLREMFEHTRKIKRMQSSSPGRPDDNIPQTSEIVVLRWNSAPPTCGWRDPAIEDELVDEIDGLPSGSSNSSTDRGAIPKTSTRTSRKPKRRSIERSEDKVEGMENEVEEDEENIPTKASDDRTFRILRLEEQCKTLIKQVLETSDDRERLEVQLKRFQDEMSPVQYAVPLEEFINKKRFERMTRASSVPITGSGSLTPREEEYTRKRSERLERLEEESRQLLSRIKRTTDRGHYLRCSLDRIRRAPVSREGSFESNTEEDTKKPEEDDEAALSSTENNSQDNSQSSNPSSSSTNTRPSPLTADEEAYTARRAARLLRLEEESKQLLNKLSKNSQRGDNIGNRLDNLHEKYKSVDEPTTETATTSGLSTLPTASTTSSTPGKMSIEQRIENIDKISSNREERLRILEEEGRQLINRLSETSEKGTKMINRIAERELNRQKRSTATPTRDSGDATKEDNTEANSSAAALLPPLKNVACTSIVSEELTDRVIITTTPSQIAAHKGAIPKSKPTLQLLASRPKSARLQKTENKKTDNANESLEDMIKRLQSLPFPGKETKQETSEESKEIEELENIEKVFERESIELEQQEEEEIAENERETAECEHMEESTELKEITEIINPNLNELQKEIVIKTPDNPEDEVEAVVATADVKNVAENDGATQD